MATGCILSDYVESAMSSATFEKLDDGTFAGKIPACQGVVAFGDTLMECQRLLQSTLEDWLLLGLRMGHAMPVLASTCVGGFFGTPTLPSAGPCSPRRRQGRIAPLSTSPRAGDGAMKQQILERARSTVEGFLHQQCANTTLGVLSVNPEVDGYGDELPLGTPHLR